MKWRLHISNVGMFFDLAGKQIMHDNAKIKYSFSMLFIDIINIILRIFVANKFPSCIKLNYLANI